MIPLTSITGLAACTIVAVGLLLSVLDARRFSTKVRIPLLVAMLALMLVPVNGLVVAGYVRGLIGDPSVTLVILAACAIVAETRARDVFDERNMLCVVLVIIATGAFLYPLTLGLTTFDPYALGYGSTVLWAAVLGVALAAWMLDLHLLLLCIMLGVPAFMLGLYESPNLWDFLIDPLAVIVSLVWLVHRLVVKRSSHAKGVRHGQDDAGDQRLTPVDMITYAFVLALVGVGVVISFVDVDAFEERYCVEDGPIEWLTVAGFLVGGVVCLRRVWVLRRRRSFRFLALTCLLGLAFVFVAGEEISWGQRILGVESSGWFQEHNAQRETNLHNIQIGDVKLNKLLFSKGIGVVLILYFAVLVPLYGRTPRLRRIVDAHAVPIPKLHQVIAILVMFVLTQGLVRSTNKGELAEFGAAFLFTLLVTLPTNRSIFGSAAENGGHVVVDE